MSKFVTDVLKVLQVKKAVIGIILYIYIYTQNIWKHKKISIQLQNMRIFITIYSYTEVLYRKS